MNATKKFSGSKLRKLREEKGLSVPACIGELYLQGVNISRPAWDYWELGTHTPSADNLYAIAQVLDVEVSELFE